MSLKRAWIVGVVGYSILRAVIAWGLFRDYGVNPWVFAAIDVGTAIPYATAVAELPMAIARSEREPTLRHLLVAVTTFLAPYGYIWAVADDAPTNLRGGLVILALCLFVAAGIGLRKKTRLARVTDRADADRQLDGDRAATTSTPSPTESRVGSRLFRHLFLPLFIVVSLGLWWWAPGRAEYPLELAVVVLFGTNLFLYVLESRVPDRSDWMVGSRERSVDAFYIVSRVILWGPLVQVIALLTVEPLIEAASLPSVWPTDWPIAARICLALLAAELVAYVIHRAFHQHPWMWRFHATHHAQTKLNSARWSATHPIEIAIVQLPVLIVATALGPELVDIAGAIVIGRSVVMLAHSNLALSSAGVGWILTTPQLHRRHHGRGVPTTVNYADVIILFDRLFGTFTEEPAAEVGLASGVELTLREQLILPARMDLIRSRPG